MSENACMCAKTAWIHRDKSRTFALITFIVFCLLSIHNILYVIDAENVGKSESSSSLLKSDAISSSVTKSISKVDQGRKFEDRKSIHKDYDSNLISIEGLSAQELNMINFDGRVIIIRFQNTGSKSWEQNVVFVGVACCPQDATDLISNRHAFTQEAIHPGMVALYIIHFKWRSSSTSQLQWSQLQFQLVAENIAWFGDRSHVFQMQYTQLNSNFPSSIIESHAQMKSVTLFRHFRETANMQVLNQHQNSQSLVSYLEQQFSMITTLRNQFRPMQFLQDEELKIQTSPFENVMIMNPSCILLNHQFIVCFRFQMPSNVDVHTTDLIAIASLNNMGSKCLLNELFFVAKHPEFLLTGEDPRIFRFAGGTFVIYNFIDSKFELPYNNK